MKGSFGIRSLQGSVGAIGSEGCSEHVGNQGKNGIRGVGLRATRK